MTVQGSFFNTIGLSGKELTTVIQSCTKQEERILKIMQSREAMTPAEVHKIYERFYDATPITSIRRAMTVLTEKGKLEKLDEMKEGIYGKPNHKWKIKPL